MPHYCSKGHENTPGSRFCHQCGEKLDQPVSLGVHPGQRLGGRYRVVRELGHGGFGRTYLAEDLNRFNELCVLKEFAPQVQGTYGLQKAEELFAREGGVLYKLQHPQIPKFREMFQVKQQHQGRLFLVQDFVEGQTYRALLDARRVQGLRFNEVEVTQLLLQILPVLEYIHLLGVIHRDIAPDNLILRNTDGLPVLIDFGGVKQVAATVASQFMAASPASATRLGKVGYAPQEQMQAGIVFPHSDLYALGATVVVLLTGKEPPQLIDPYTGTWNWRREVNLSPFLGSILDKMLSPRPGDRYQTARQLLQDLQQPQPALVAVPPTVYPSPPIAATVAVGSPPVEAKSPPPSLPAAETPLPSSPSPQSSGLWGKILLMLLLVIVAGGIGWGAGNWWIQSHTQPDIDDPSLTDDEQVFPPPNDSEPEPPPQFSIEERERKEALRERRRNLGIDYNYYIDAVNEAFWTVYPNLRGRQLGTEPEDVENREQWDAIASDLLRHIEQLNLSASARQKLGNYGEQDLTRLKDQANQLRVSSRALYDLADARFFEQFPQQQGRRFINKPIGQVWQAIVSHTLKALQSGGSLEQIAFEPGAVSKQISGSLKPGEGKAFIANLSAGQLMGVKLNTAQEALFSLYSPTGQTTLLEDSRDRMWSGELPESGFYEFVVVSDAKEPIEYKLDLTVQDSTPPEDSTEPESAPPESPEPETTSESQ